MTSPIEVPFAALYTHAQSVSFGADRTETARSAASTVHLDRDAYGLLCQFMPAYFEPGMELVVEAIGETRVELTRLAAGLRAAAGGYGGSDNMAVDRATGATTLRDLPL